MADISTLYAAICTEGEDPYVLTDGINYTLSGTEEWRPRIPEDQHSLIVEENPMGIDALGGPNNSASIALRNARRLAKRLRQAQESQFDKSIPTVWFEFTPPNAEPRVINAAQITNWFPAGFLSAINSTQNLTTGSIEDLILQFERNHPFIVKEFYYKSLFPDGIWSADPSWFGSGAGGVFSWVDAPLPLGHGYLNWSGTGTVQATAPAVGGFAVTSGSPITIVVRAVKNESDPVQLTAILRNNINSADISNVSDVVQLTEESIEESGSSAVYVLTVTPNATNAQARLRFTITGACSFGEIAVYDGDLTADPWVSWAPQYEEYSEAESASADIPAIHTLDLPSHPDRSPFEIRVGDVVESFSGFGTFGPSVLAATDGYIGITDFNSGTGQWAAFNDSAKIPLGGSNVARFTPSSADTYVANSTLIDVDYQNYRHYAFFGALRNNSATQRFLVRLKFLVRARINADPNFTLYTIPAFVPPSSPALPLLMYLGELVLPESAANASQAMQLEAKVKDTVGGTLDVDRIISVAVTPTTKIVSIQKFGEDDDGSVIVASPNWLTDIESRLSLNNIVDDGLGNISYPHLINLPSIDSPLFFMENGQVKVLFDAVSHDDNLWRESDDGVSPLSRAIYIKRYAGIEVPL